MDNLISYIDLIEKENVVAESTVISSLINLYEKESMISFIQEGKILDEATGKDKKENTFVKILLFLPRLVVAFFKSLFGKKEASKETVKEFEIAGVKLDKLKDMDPEERDELIKKINDLKEVTNQGVKFKWDDKSKVLKCSSKINILLALGTAISAVKLIQKIAEELVCDSSSSIQKFKNDCDELLHIRSIDELKNRFNDRIFKDVNDGLDCIFDLAGYLFTITATISVTVALIEKKVNAAAKNKEILGVATKEDVERTKNAKELCNKITQITNKVAGISGLISMLKMVNDTLGFVNNAVNISRTKEKINNTKFEQYLIDSGVGEDYSISNRTPVDDLGFYVKPNDLSKFYNFMHTQANNMKSRKHANADTIDSIVGVLKWINDNELLAKFNYRLKDDDTLEEDIDKIPAKFFNQVDKLCHDYAADVANNKAFADQMHDVFTKVRSKEILNFNNKSRKEYIDNYNNYCENIAKIVTRQCETIVDNCFTLLQKYSDLYKSTLKNYDVHRNAYIKPEKEFTATAKNTN